MPKFSPRNLDMQGIILTMQNWVWQEDGSPRKARVENWPWSCRSCISPQAWAESGVFSIRSCLAGAGVEWGGVGWWGMGKTLSWESQRKHPTGLGIQTLIRTYVSCRLSPGTWRPEKLFLLTWLLFLLLNHCTNQTKGAPTLACVCDFFLTITLTKL